MNSPQVVFIIIFFSLIIYGGFLILGFLLKGKNINAQKIDE
mgnify:CR=1 FL=1